MLGDLKMDNNEIKFAKKHELIGAITEYSRKDR